MKFLQKVHNVRGLLGRGGGGGGGGSLHIKVARDQENIFHFEFCVNIV